MENDTETYERQGIVKHIWILSIFPKIFDSFLSYGVVASALRGERGFEFDIHFLNLHDFSPFKYKNVDDRPYGGGPGMIMRADILKLALESIYKQRPNQKFLVIAPSPRGKIFDQKMAKDFAYSELLNDKRDLIFICGRYEGIDERFLSKYVDLEVSVGDYILSGGELAVMTILDASLRFIKGTLSNEESVGNESFSTNTLEYPQYTRPYIFEDEKVPEILLSGHHSDIEHYRLSEAMRLTHERRPDLYAKYIQKENLRDKSDE